MPSGTVSAQRRYGRAAADKPQVLLDTIRQVTRGDVRTFPIQPITLLPS